MDEHGILERQVAIAGLALRVPDADSPSRFWSNLLAGAVAQAPAKADTVGIESAVGRDRRRVRQIDRIAAFDQALFGMSSTEALIADPQQRALLELAWAALEDAGLDPRESPGRVGVFVGCGREDYRRLLLEAEPDLETVHGRQQIEIGTDRDYLAAALAYRLDLSGPCLTVQSACSTSLVAVTVAVRSLLTAECDVAIAGGVTIQMPVKDSYDYHEGGIYAADGLCRPFIGGGDGTVPASGGGVVVLVRAEDVADLRLRPYAHIVGTAVTNDGAERMNFAAPSTKGHVAAIREALDFAGLEPHQIGFVQTHGTGTRLGDEIELAALRQTYGVRLDDGAAPPCALGAVKANIGHTDTAAGVIGLIACALAVRTGRIPPVPCQPGDGAALIAPNQGSGDRLVLPRQPIPWPGAGPRRGAVSALGLGGTNAHAVLEEAPAPASRATAPYAIITLSAVTDSALQAQGRQLAAHLRDAASSLDTVASTLWHGRRALSRRWAVTVPTTDAGRRAAVEELDRVAAANAGPANGAAPPALALLIPGQGLSVDPGYRDLLRDVEPVRAAFLPLRDAVLAADGPDLLAYESMADDDPRLTETEFVQPLLFALQGALVRALRVTRARLVMVVGQSLGEVVAAAAAGVFGDDASAAAMIVRRAAAMADGPQGGMMAVQAPRATVEALATEFGLTISGILSKTLHTLAGDEAAVHRCLTACKARRLGAMALPARRAFHTQAMVSAGARLATHLAPVRLAPPSFDIASNVTGRPLTADNATSPAYWDEQMRVPVDVAGAIDTLLTVRPAVVLDIGPGTSLSSLVRERARAMPEAPRVLTLSGARGRTSVQAMLETLCTVWRSGCDVTLPVARRPVDRLPSYPFEGPSAWPRAPTAPSDASSDAPGNVPAAGPVAEPPPTAARDDAVGGTGDGDMAALVRRIWATAFGAESLTDDDSFFDLGGTSIHAAQIIRRVQTECGARVRLHDLYDIPGLGEFCEHVIAQAGAVPPVADSADTAPGEPAECFPAADDVVDASRSGVLAAARDVKTPGHEGDRP